ncbi:MULTISPECIES: superoxide dismutase [Asticcacaulis]|uniref:superoxide dismutase n=1 Tax=Asticcacaulis TaxID=76890 RepID=UPI001AE1AA5C|nr:MULTISPECIES: superoxide dismutase [Asticcacaulis]MBP2158294.1 Fe-Mn family superoxide dismutase [Asticcacaulis solisilvae]MDR6799339.1 Fe-Mn family superoxide dismutase [Asticcacaulis sp. BE141]
MAFELPPLPYAADALEPHMSANTFSFHHAKHHKAYVDNLNKLIAGTEFEGKSLVEVVQASEGKNPGVFNNAAQVWNHTFFWSSMKPNGGGQPTGEIADRINSDFGSFDAFAEAFKTAGATQFGSGWAWLVLGSDGKLKVTKTPNAETPFTKGDKPILTCDVWEHAYYLDYQNLRPKFLEVFLASLVNWDFANQNLAAPLHPGV